MNIITFDLEDWFHLLEHEETKGPGQWEGFQPRIEANTNKILNLLDAYQVKATFFVLGWVAEKYPELVKSISLRGHEIGCHSYAHQLVHQQSPKEFEKDLDLSLYHLEEATGKKITAYRAPGFSITNESVWALTILAQAGIQIDSSMFISSRAHGGFSNFPLRRPGIITLKNYQLKEFPIIPANIWGAEVIYSGGGYFRLLPKALLLKLFNSNQYNMTYFHPRDFDSYQPIVPGLSLIRKFKSYYGLRSALSKLEFLLQNIKFVSLGVADAAIDWRLSSQVFLNSQNTFEIQNNSSLMSQ